MPLKNAFYAVCVFGFCLSVKPVASLFGDESSPSLSGAGENSFGQATIPPFSGPPALLSAGWDYNVILDASGTLLAWGREDDGRTQPPATDGTVVAISAGSNHALVLFDDGRIEGWGVNTDGLARAPEGIGPASSIACGAFHNLALLRDGSLIAWGYKGDARLEVPVSPVPFKAIAAGRDHSLALTEDGRVFAWGANGSGQTSVPEDLTEVVSIAAGASHSLALRRDGSVVAWGLDEQGQCQVPSDLAGVVMISAGNQHSLALLGDGTLRSWGANGKGQRNLTGTGFSAIAAGAFHTLAKRGGSPPNPGVFSWEGLSVSDLIGNSARLRGNLVLAPAGVGYRRGFVLAASVTGANLADGIVVEGGAGGSGPMEVMATGLLPGTRYYVRAFAETPDGVAYSSASEFLAGADSRAQPDVAAGPSAARLVGVGDIGDPTVQTTVLASKKGRKVSGLLQISNQGSSASGFLVSARGGNRLLPVRYRLDGRNVTASIRSGKLETPVLAPEAGASRILLTVTPHRSLVRKKKGKVRKLRARTVFTASTPDAPVLSDQAILDLRTR